MVPATLSGDQLAFFSNMVDRLSVRHYHVVQVASHAPVDAPLLASLLAAERRDRAAWRDGLAPRATKPEVLE
jgi:hypothetical protein